MRHIAKRIINHLKNVINHCDLIGQCFPEQSPPILVLNAGGWSKDGFLNDKDKQERYDILKDSLIEVNAESVQMLFKRCRHFHGTLEDRVTTIYFVDPDEIDSFCSDTGAKICLDVSHSMMACNYYGWNLSAFVPESRRPHILPSYC